MIVLKILSLTQVMGSSVPVFPALQEHPHISTERQEESGSGYGHQGTQPAY